MCLVMKENIERKVGRSRDLSAPVRRSIYQKLSDGKTDETGKCAEISAQRVHEKEKMDYEI